MTEIGPNYRRAAELAGLSTETGKTLAALATAADALWRIAGFAIQVDEAPPEGDAADDSYDHGENAALWMDGMTALRALAEMGDSQATAQLERCKQLEEARDADNEDEDA